VRASRPRPASARAAGGIPSRSASERSSVASRSCAVSARSASVSRSCAASRARPARAYSACCFELFRRRAAARRIGLGVRELGAQPDDQACGGLTLHRQPCRAACGARRRTESAAIALRRLRRSAPPRWRRALTSSPSSLGLRRRAQCVLRREQPRQRLARNALPLPPARPPRRVQAFRGLERRPLELRRLDAGIAGIRRGIRRAPCVPARAAPTTTRARMPTRSAALRSLVEHLHRLLALARRVGELLFRPPALGEARPRASSSAECRARSAAARRLSVSPSRSSSVSRSSSAIRARRRANLAAQLLGALGRGGLQRERPQPLLDLVLEVACALDLDGHPRELQLGPVPSRLEAADSPAASSISARRSSGFEARIASTLPWPMIECIPWPRTEVGEDLDQVETPDRRLVEQVLPFAAAVQPPREPRARSTRAARFRPGCRRAARPRQKSAGPRASPPAKRTSSGFSSARSSFGLSDPAAQRIAIGDVRFPEPFGRRSRRRPARGGPRPDRETT